MGSRNLQSGHATGFAGRCGCALFSVAWAENWQAPDRFGADGPDLWSFSTPAKTPWYRRRSGRSQALVLSELQLPVPAAYCTTMICARVKLNFFSVGFMMLTWQSYFPG